MSDVLKHHQEKEGYVEVLYESMQFFFEHNYAELGKLHVQLSLVSSLIIDR